jgi:hypothetical protein
VKLFRLSLNDRVLKKVYYYYFLLSLHACELLHYSRVLEGFEEKFQSLLNSLCLLASGYCDIHGPFELRTKNVTLPATTKGKARMSCELKSRVLFLHSDSPSYLVVGIGQGYSTLPGLCSGLFGAV